ncbi:histidine kinase [Streptomyces longwoodensis]|uniref:histidine kinase n=1 Tax=Streptomyces longwoodensis TaxID=68231 RepID=A0A117QQH7_9ACTN|nr:hybrid sensor histidine kinase/response regulator [Streptomyces longwoodensis]KUN41274.1 histidine kinase [Streptomyces longwoodensis]
MTPGPPGHDLLTIALREGGDVIRLRRCTQVACRAAGLTGSPLVRLTTVVSEAGEHLLGTPGLSAHLRLEETDAVMMTVRLRWPGDRRPPATLLAAAGRLLDGSGLGSSSQDGAQELLLAQRTPVPPESLGGLAADVRARLADGDTAADLIEALRTQNGQLLAALEESQHQQDELQRLNAELEETNAGVMALYAELAGELEETNTGVVALYAELEDKSRQLELANEYKTRFWANVSHELRSPVNSIIALARLLLDPSAEPLSDEQQQQVALVQASGSTLLALVDELLDVAKAESGRLEPHPVDVDLRPLLHQLRGTLRGTARPGVALSIPDHVQQGPLVTDEVMLTRILRNVLSNALKFTPAGSVALDVSEEGSGDGARFVFRVRDTGVGIPAAELERVFEEFYQVQGPHQRGRAGTGLGLPYARRLAELLGGTLTLDSEAGHGTTVTFRLPARLPWPVPQDATTAPDDPAHRPAPPSAPGGPTGPSEANPPGPQSPLPGPNLAGPPSPSPVPDPVGPQSPSPVPDPAGPQSPSPAPDPPVAAGSPAPSRRTDGADSPAAGKPPVVAHVVVVDDDEAFLAVVAPLLRGLAASVTVLSDSSRAVATVESQQPDLVLLDLTMPVADGYRVHRSLAANPRTRHIPVAVLTALEADQVDGSRLPGVRAVLNKSRLTPEDVTAVLAGLPTPPGAARPHAPHPDDT